MGWLRVCGSGWMREAMLSNSAENLFLCGIFLGLNDDNTFRFLNLSREMPLQISWELIFIVKYKIMSICMYLCMGRTLWWGLLRRTEAMSFLELELQAAVSHSTWVQGTELRPSGRILITSLTMDSSPFREAESVNDSYHTCCLSQSHLSTCFLRSCGFLTSSSCQPVCYFCLDCSVLVWS